MEENKETTNKNSNDEVRPSKRWKLWTAGAAITSLASAITTMAAPAVTPVTGVLTIVFCIQSFRLLNKETKDQKKLANKKNDTESLVRR